MEFAMIEQPEAVGTVDTRFGHKVTIADFQRINDEVMKYSRNMFLDHGIVMSYDDINSMFDERFAAAAIH